ncbi:unnamed protein product [Cuscuta epithymum]|uniref:Uncharacterized protein n=1 Tax=Cuscuta epithymum TaxID=186058 RepID=A0AAV0CRA8_9ASTE|nr:unnamed protein product [Cuscuta epithymum]CAH9120884.1 unnamed protein product [Cuscuta epithymum]
MFYCALLRERDILKEAKNRVSHNSLEDFGVLCASSEIEEYDLGSFISISSLIFHEDLIHNGYSSSTGSEICSIKTENLVKGDTQEGLIEINGEKVYSADAIVEEKPLQAAYPSSDGREIGDTDEANDDEITYIRRELTARELLDRITDPVVSFTGYRIEPIRRSARIKAKQLSGH